MVLLKYHNTDFICLGFNHSSTGSFVRLRGPQGLISLSLDLAIKSGNFRTFEEKEEYKRNEDEDFLRRLIHFTFRIEF